MAFIYYDAKYPTETSPKIGSMTYTHGDCAIRAWSKALDFDYWKLVRNLEIFDPHIMIGNNYEPWWNITWDTSGDRRKKEAIDKFITTNRWQRTLREFPRAYNWACPYAGFGKYVKDHRYGDNPAMDSKPYTDPPITVGEFAKSHPVGRYVIDCENKKASHDTKHVTCIVNGDIYDNWDPSEWTVRGWWLINENKVQIDKNNKKIARKKSNLFREFSMNNFSERVSKLLDTSLKNYSIATVGEMVELVSGPLKGRRGRIRGHAADKLDPENKISIISLLDDNKVGTDILRYVPNYDLRWWDEDKKGSIDKNYKRQEIPANIYDMDWVKANYKSIPSSKEYEKVAFPYGEYSRGAPDYTEDGKLHHYLTPTLVKSRFTGKLTLYLYEVLVFRGSDEKECLIERDKFLKKADAQLIESKVFKTGTPKNIFENYCNYLKQAQVILMKIYEFK